MKEKGQAMQSGTPTSNIPLRLLWVVVIAGFAIIAIILLWGRSSNLQQSVAPPQLSLRQHAGLIQYKPTSAEDTDDNWHTITTISALTGKDGQDGQDGKDGTDGQNGTNGTNGSDGTNGQNGTTGQSGPQGEQGEQGIQGIQGTPGANGTDGQDGADGKDGTDGTNGIDGQDGTNGTDGIDGVNGTDGTDGREIELQKDLYFIQWRYIGEPGWRNLIAYAELKGDKGDTGDTGLTGATGPANTLSIGTVTRTDCNPTASITGTSPAQTLNLGIPGLPTGGMAGQVLTKNSTTDCDASWQSTGELKGTGMPNGVVTAPTGTYYTDTAGTNGAWRWLKTAGTGNTGWTVVYGNTGERRYSTDYLLNGYTQYLTFPHISPHVARVGNTVFWSGALSSIQEGLANGEAILEVPLGFRPDSTTTGTIRGVGGGNTVITSITIPSNNKLSFTHSVSVPVNLTYGTIQFSYVTKDPWPEILPGTAP